MTDRFTPSALFLAALAVVAPSAQAANLLTNGGFETPVYVGLAKGCWVYCNYGAGGSSAGTSFAGWTVVDLGAGGVDTSPARDGYVSLVPNNAFSGYGVSSPYGSQFADLTGINGQGKGLRSDAVVTEVGATYQVSFALGEFWVAGQGSYGEAAVNVSINGVDQGLFRNLQSLTSAGSDWQTVSFNYVATSTLTSLQITNALGPGYSYLGTGLDNVSLSYLAAAPVVASVPEPETYALMLAGLGLLSAAGRRRAATGSLPLSGAARPAR